MTSSGAYTLKTWKSNIEISVSKNSFYWDSTNVKINNIKFVPVENQLTAYNMFKRNEGDMIFSIPSSKIKEASAIPGFYSRSQYGTYFYMINCQKSPGNNVHFRRALALSIDREKIVKYITKGGQKAAYSLLPKLTHSDLKNKFVYDTIEALKELKLSGFSSTHPPPQFEILFNNSETNKSIAEAIAQMWKSSLGLEAILVNYEWKVFLEATQQKKYSSVARGSWIGDYLDPLTFLELAESSNGNNRTGFQNPTFDSLLVLAQQEVEPGKRWELYDQLNNILIQEAPIIPIYFFEITELHHPDLVGAKSDALGNYVWKDFSWKN